MQSQHQPYKEATKKKDIKLIVYYFNLKLKLTLKAKHCILKQCLTVKGMRIIIRRFLIVLLDIMDISLVSPGLYEL